MKLLLIDDHHLFLDGLKQVIQKYIPGCEVHAESTIERAKHYIENNKNIDLILVDLDMPKFGGVQLIQALSQQKTIQPIAVLSATKELNQIQNLLELGALGFIPKDYESTKLISAIHEIIDGNIHLPDSLRYALEEQEENIISKQLSAEKHEVTPRQLEVLSLIDKGFANSKIANHLCISEHTVKSHLKQVFRALDVTNRIECVNKAKLLKLL